MFEKVQTVKRPLKKGELFLVPCIVKSGLVMDENWNDTVIHTRDFSSLQAYSKKNLEEINPVIMHPHNDIENGQRETHYHLDYRFIRTGDWWKGKEEALYAFPPATRSHRTHQYGTAKRPINGHDGEIYYFLLPVVNPDFIFGVTHPNAISKSKLKHKCIHKGKCPHRGMDLSQVNPINGVITCPLHGLKFSAQTKELING